MGNKRKYLIYVVFGLSVIYGAWFHFMRDNSANKANQSGIIPITAQNFDEEYSDADILNEPAPALAAIELPTLSDKWGKDPFLVHNAGEILSNSYSELGSGEPKLTGISYHQNSHSFAIINNKVLQASEKIDGWQIVSIYNDYVIIKKSGVSKKLIMGEKL